jgi:sensor histidine kinase YesM
MLEAFSWTLIPVFNDFRVMEHKQGFLSAFLFHNAFLLPVILVPVNIILWLKQARFFKSLSFTKHNIIFFITIVAGSVAVTLLLNYYFNNFSSRYFKWAFSFTAFFAAITGAGFLFYTYAHYEKKQIVQARELEISRLNELKTKAELETLHAKINPHFLYNALNSIADHTITDGKKAREMTIALSELFRYTINYCNSNYSTIEEEVKMAEIYLHIEKIRFGDNLEYTIQMPEEARSFKVPRFIMQPLVENAVKHGLASNRKGVIHIDVALAGENLEIKIFDTGSVFDDILSQGYGLKSVHEKLEILYHGLYQLQFVSHPRKHVLLILKKTSVNEAAA